MDLGFGGEVADFYHQYRCGYPPAVTDQLAGTFGLTGDDIVIDLGCGTGQLTLPIAARVRAVAGVDPEPDMLARARRAAAEQHITNVAWILGATPAYRRWRRCSVTGVPVRSRSARPCTGCATASCSPRWHRCCAPAAGSP